MNETRWETLTTTQKGITPEDYINSDRCHPASQGGLLRCDYGERRPKVQINKNGLRKPKMNGLKKKLGEWAIPKEEIVNFFKLNPDARQCDLRHFYGLKVTTARFYYQKAKEIIANERK